jgi:ureidoglycolate lyase
MRTLRAAPLTSEAFARFGDVIEMGANSTTVNQGRGRRFDLALDLRPADPRAKRPAAAIYRINPSALPFEVSMIERHPLTAQLFYPNRAGRFLICVFDARPDGEPDTDSAHAFIGNAGQGVVYRAGTWHGPLVALDTQGDFLMQMCECGGPLDCEERTLESPLTISP